jgi:hypothetical protein
MKNYYKYLITIWLCTSSTYATTVDTLKTACEVKHNLEQCYQLGLAYSKGDGIRQNSTYAKRYFSLACNHGLEIACTALKGRGEPIREHAKISQNNVKKNTNSEKTINTSISPDKDSDLHLTMSQEIEKLVGTWYDPFNIILKKGDIIRISHEGGNAVGEDTKGEITISIAPVGINQYRGHFIFHGIDSDNDVRYDIKNRKLIFTNRLSGMDFSIKKR